MPDRDHNQPEHNAPAVTACGGKIDQPERYPSAMHNGQIVYFCTLACLEAFKRDPDRFMAGEIEHPIAP